MRLRVMINRAASGLFILLPFVLACDAQAAVVNEVQAKLEAKTDCTGEGTPHKLALLIGVEEYQTSSHGLLVGSGNDVELVANGLRARGFLAAVLKGTKATKFEADKAWQTLATKAKCGDHVVLMLSGLSSLAVPYQRWAYLFQDAEMKAGTFVKGIWYDLLLNERISDLRYGGIHVTLIADVDHTSNAKLFPPPNGCCETSRGPEYSTASMGSLTLLGAPRLTTEERQVVDGVAGDYGTFSYALGKLIAQTGALTLAEARSRLTEIYRQVDVKNCNDRWNENWQICRPYTATTHPDAPLFHTGPIEVVQKRSATSSESSELPPPSAEVLIDSSDGKAARGGARIAGTLITGQVKPADGLLALEIAGRRVPDVQPDGRFRVEVPLRRGDNDVEVAAMYTNRPHMVTRITVHSTGGKWLAERPANSYALLIANQRYDKASSGFGPLSTPKADAERLAEELRARYGFRTSLPRSDGSERPLILHDANRADIFRALDDIARVATPEDVVLVFYAGHGEQLKSALPNGRTISRTYWVPTDSRAEDGDVNWVSAQDIDTKIARIRARHVLLVSDSCFAGGLNRGGGGDITLQNAEPDRYLSEMSRKPSRYLLASGGNHPVDDGQGHSPFAQALLNALRNPPAPAFTLQQVFPALQKHVTNSTNQVPEFPPLRGDAGAAGDGGAMVFFASKL